MAYIRNIGARKPEFRYRLRCTRCGAIPARIGEHWKTCVESIGINRRELKVEAHKDTNYFLKHRNLNKSEFKRICYTPGARNRWAALKGSLLRVGHHFKGGDVSSGDDDELEDEQEVVQRTAVKPKVVGKASKALDDALKLKEAPEIHDPTAGINYQKDGVKSRLQDAGLFRRFKNTASFLIRYRHYRVVEQRAADQVIAQEVEYCGRLFAYIFNQLDMPEQSFDSDNDIAGSLKLELVRQFFEECSECGQSDQTISSMEKSFKAMAKFLMYHCDGIDKEHRRLAKLFYNNLISRGKGTNKGIVSDNAAKKAKKFAEDDIMLEDIRKLMETDKALKMLDDAAARLKLPEGVGKEKFEYEQAYQFLVRYCICSLCLYSGQRSQVPKNMTLDEFRTKKIANEGVVNEEPVYTIYLKDHKNQAGGAHKVAILERHAKWFDFYIEHCRKADPGETHLFVGYRSGKKLTNVPTMIHEFQKSLGVERPYTTTEIRHIIETNSETLFQGDQAAANAIHKALGHSGLVARKNYIDPKAQHAYPGVLAMSRLRKAGSAEQSVGSRLLRKTSAPSIPLVKQLTAKDEKWVYLQEKYLGRGCDSDIPTRGQLGRDKEMAGEDKKEVASWYDKLKNTRNDLRIAAMGDELSNEFRNSSENQEYWLQRCQLIAINKKWSGIQWSRFWPKFQRAASTGSQQAADMEVGDEGAGIDDDYIDDDDPEEEEEEQQQQNEEMAYDLFEQFDEHAGPANDDYSAEFQPDDTIAATASQASQHTVFDISDDDDDDDDRPQLARTLASVKAKAKEKPTFISRLYLPDDIIMHCDDQTLWPNLEIKETEDRGRGVFAGSQGFVSHQLVCDYNGVRRRTKDHIEYLQGCPEDVYKWISSYALELDQFKVGSYPSEPAVRWDRIPVVIPVRASDPSGYTIEAHIDDDPPSYGRLINHCKSGHENVMPYLKEYNGRAVVLFFTTKKIGPGEELLWYYGPHFADQPWFNNCHCKNCQKKKERKK